MRRAELEHVLRAASALLDERDLLVVGSAAVLASFRDERLPLEASRSDEADLAAFDDPGDVKADLIDGRSVSSRSSRTRSATTRGA